MIDETKKYENPATTTKKEPGTDRLAAQGAMEGGVEVGGYGKEKSKTGHAYDKSIEKAGEAYDKTAQKAGEVYDKTAQTVSDVYDKTAQAVSQTYEQTKVYSSENPGKTILIALGIGVGLGFIWGASSRQSRYGYGGRYTRPIVNAAADLAREFFG